MPRTGKKTPLRWLWALLAGCLACAGCTSGRELTTAETDWRPAQIVRTGGDNSVLQSNVKAAQFEHHELAGPPPSLHDAGPVAPTLPRELEKASHPTYVIEPPDILIVDAVRLIPRPPYRVEPLDALAIMVTGALPKAPIEGIYSVDPSGNVNLGFTYGTVRLHGQTLEEAKAAIEKHLKEKLNPPYEVYVSLAESRVMQQVRGEHLVRQDGTIGLGTYGSVYVTGMTIAQAKAAIENHLSQFLFEPRVSVDVAGFNSHVYYVIFDFPGTGQQIFRLPITGNETVLDALGDLRGLPPGTSKRRVWVARPSPTKSGHTQILPVDLPAITRSGSIETNYQLLPGDRVYVSHDQLAALDAALSRVFSPIERVFGITLFGNSVVQNLRSPNAFGNTGVR